MTGCWGASIGFPPPVILNAVKNLSPLRGNGADLDRYKTASANAASRISIAASTSAFVTISGGQMRSTLACRPPLPTIRPRSLARVHHAQGEVGAGLLRRAVADELDRDHQAHAADVADDVVALGQLAAGAR